MGRGATVSAGNRWYEARKNASLWNDKLKSKEGAAEALCTGIDAVDSAERNKYKQMPPELAVAMARVYNAPELKNYYCLNWCPIGCGRAISDERVSIDRVAVQISKMLRKESVQVIKHGVQDIAADGKILDDEIPLLKEIMNELREWTKTISNLETISESVASR